MHTAGGLEHVKGGWLDHEPLKACWHCHWWGGLTPSGCHSYCDRPKAAQVQATPITGCAYFTREPGSDDDPLRLPDDFNAFVPPWQAWGKPERNQGNL